MYPTLGDEVLWASEPMHANQNQNLKNITQHKIDRFDFKLGKSRKSYGLNFMM
jgi:hypothetical protein